MTSRSGTVDWICLLIHSQWLKCNWYIYEWENGNGEEGEEEEDKTMEEGSNLSYGCLVFCNIAVADIIICMHITCVRYFSA